MVDTWYTDIIHVIIWVELRWVEIYLLRWIYVFSQLRLWILSQLLQSLRPPAVTPARQSRSCGRPLSGSDYIHCMSMPEAERMETAQTWRTYFQLFVWRVVIHIVHSSRLLWSRACWTVFSSLVTSQIVRMIVTQFCVTLLFGLTLYYITVQTRRQCRLYCVDECADKKV